MRKTAALTQSARERRKASRRRSNKTATAMAASRNIDQYLTSMAAAAASPSTAAQPLRRVSSARMSASIASDHNGISAEFWSNFSPR